MKSRIVAFTAAGPSGRPTLTRVCRAPFPGMPLRVRTQITMRRSGSSVELQSAGPNGKKRLLATREITRLPGARGRYEAAFMEDCLDDLMIEPFVHRPARLDHWQLLQTALAWRLAGDESLPPRPFVLHPDGVPAEEGVNVRLAELVEPAQTCFARWLARHGYEKEFSSGLATERQYLDFLHALA